ncbi:hypothetical protein EW146_g3210 [Bondarzewia mesenterica]|uniref:Uncharacterized protein n=1 Tax=Bondarzewia mesenterica TaxID=1095465 RepID=A0A4S4M0I1_9AGAM|nr:hypothetical protein EW146_g3210 [Bondarzewia mesenterica]
MGCSPYFAATGIHPLVSLDIAKATYLLPPSSSFLFSTDLIACHAITLQKCKSNLTSLHSKVYEARIQAVIKFECDHITTIHDFNFQPSSLILMRYSVIEKNCGGAYILCELNGSVYDCPITAFWVIPYFAHQLIPLPDLDKLLDISVQHLQELEASPTADPEALDDDLVILQDEDFDKNLLPHILVTED